MSRPVVWVAIAAVAWTIAAHGAAAGPESSPVVDLNRASPEEIHALPIPASVADAILDHRTYVAYFTSLFELMSVPGMTPELLAALKPRVRVMPVFETQILEQAEDEFRAGELNSLVQRLLSEEGTNEGLVDDYVDQVRDPRNVNRMGLYDLLSYTNVSPVDAVAVLRERRAAGTLENARQLRAAPGISYWGYRNLRDYVRFTEPPSVGQNVHLDAQVRVYNTPYTLDDEDILNENILGNTSGLSQDQKQPFRNYDLNTYAGRLDLDTTDPYLTQKFRARVGRNVRVGFLTHRNLGERQWNETAKAAVTVVDLPERATPLGPLRLRALSVGNYTVAFGQGLVMDATDFFSARRTGYGYGVRSIGVRGDGSRSEEFTLRGVAMEGSLGPVAGTFFYSSDDKDAILNPDGSINRYIVMRPRLSDELLAGIRSDIATGVFAGRGDTSSYLPMRDVVDERVLGANLRVDLAPGASVGVTAVDIDVHNNAMSTPVSDRFDPQPTSLVIDPARLEDRDAEIGQGYNSVNLGSYRRVWGADARAVYRNLAWAGEYAKLETSTESGGLARVFANGPEAKVTHAYLQFENFNVFALYRDYDPGYDNPYARPFSEDARYEQTILDGNAYRLKNPYWAQLARYLPQPKSERGWYLSARYQINRLLTLSGVEYDTWTRRADGADLSRFVARLEYRPIFPVRVRLRHAISSRHAARLDDVRAYEAWDSRLELLANLSQYDQLRFMYSTGNVMFAGRGRLSGPAAGGDVQADSTAMRGDPGHALQGVMTHQFTPALAITVSTEVYDGFLYNYEDNEFVVVDGTGFRSWFLVRSRLSDRLSWRLRWVTNHVLPRTFVDIRDFGSLVPPTPDAANAGGDRSSFRFQLDYSL